MRVRNVARSNSEVRTDSVLRAALQKRGYRVERNMRVSDVIELDQQGLSEEEMHCYRNVHFDFTITQRAYGTPRFVVEFDGPHHTLDSTAAHLDAVKNDLCRRAELPILRVSSRELEQNERVSLLAWMLERWIAWQQEGPALRREVNAERGRLLHAGMHPAELADPSGPASAEFYFDQSHPYPAVLTVAARLHRLGIVTLRASDDLVAQLAAARAPEHLAQCIALSAGEGPEGANSRYVDCEAEVRRWQPGQTSIDLKGPILYTARERVVWRWALPIGWDAPSVVASEPEVATFEDRAEWWIRAMGFLWNCHLAGAPSHQVAEGLGEYLVLRDVEQWARRHFRQPG